MKLNLGKLLRGAVKIVKENPEIALGVAGAIAPKVVKKVAPIIIAATVAKQEPSNGDN